MIQLEKLRATVFSIKIQEVIIHHVQMVFIIMLALLGADHLIPGEGGVRAMVFMCKKKIVHQMENK